MKKRINRLPLKINNKNEFKITSINVRSLYQIKDELVNLLNLEKVEIACIQETWLRYNKKINIPGYKIFHNDIRVNPGGGTAILIKNNIKIKPITKYNSENGIGLSLIKLSNKYTKKDFYICNTYITPDAKIQEINTLFEKIKNNINNTLILGDLNTHLKNGV